MTDLTQSFLAQVEQVTPPPIDWGAMAPLLVVLGAACVAVLVEAFLPRLPQIRARLDEDVDAAFRSDPAARGYARASRIMLNGVAAALRNCEKPPLRTTSPIRFSPACAPSARPTS